MVNTQKHADAACQGCIGYELNLCRALRLLGPEGAPAGLPFREHKMPARRLIWRERETVETVPVVCDGWAATAVTLSDGRRQILSFVLPGEIVSAYLIVEPVITCSVEAVTNLRYRTFARADVKAALGQCPDLIAMLGNIRNEETMRADQLAVDLGQRDAAERIARLIVSLSERLARRGLVRDGTFEFPLRQHHIADATGLTVVHAGKVLTEFRRAGLMEINGRALTLIDAAGLRRVGEMH